MTDMLIQLTAQAEARGADLVTLRALIEEASEVGARRVLVQLGLQDERAARDMGDLRELLSAWRDAKSSARKAVIVACCTSASARRLRTSATSTPTRARNSASERASSDAASGSDMSRVDHASTSNATSPPGNLPRLRVQCISC